MTGEWDKKSADRRDTRNDKSTPEVGKSKPGKKNTKKWCRGKEGVEHKLKCVDYNSVKSTYVGLNTGLAKGWKLLICETCGKELERYFPMSFLGRKPKTPPEWVK